MKNFLVIGGSSGIGLALVQRLALTHQVWATYHTHPQENTQVQYFKYNALDHNLEASAFPESLDGLAYCVGAVNLKPFARVKIEDMMQDYQLQVLGAVSAIQACLPALKKSGKASIVLFSTVAVQSGFSFHSIVSASKGAIEGLTRSLAAELAPSIRVNAIAPSITATPLTALLLNSEDKINANIQRHPLKAIGSAENVAEVASFLLQDTSSWITGQVLHVDGGIGDLKI
jgi:NAD(P)-dependent dehydrogenase (short-subunit alcohol dehydrogenase family)